MQYRTVGKTGIKVSEIGFGCGNNAILMVKAPYEDQRQAVRHALDLGINFFDTSDVYGPYTNERLLGSAFRGRRKEVVIATKFGIQRDPQNPAALVLPLPPLPPGRYGSIGMSSRSIRIAPKAASSSSSRCVAPVTPQSAGLRRVRQLSR